MTRRIASSVLLLVFVSCSGTFSPRIQLRPGPPGHEDLAGPSVPPAECSRLQSAARGWGASAAFSAGLAGSGGIGVAAAQSKDQATQIGIGASVAFLSAWAILSSYLMGSYTTQLHSQCEAAPIMPPVAAPPVKP